MTPGGWSSRRSANRSPHDASAPPPRRPSRCWSHRACARGSTGCAWRPDPKAQIQWWRAFPGDRAGAFEPRHRIGVVIGNEAGQRFRATLGRKAGGIEMSLIPTGTPWSGPRKRPSRASRSSTAAAPRAPARSIAAHALIAPSSRSMRASNASTSSTGESLRSRTRRAASVRVSAYGCAIASPLRRAAVATARAAG